MPPFAQSTQPLIDAPPIDEPDGGVLEQHGGTGRRNDGESVRDDVNRDIAEHVELLVSPVLADVKKETIARSILATTKRADVHIEAKLLAYDTVDAIHAALQTTTRSKCAVVNLYKVSLQEPSQTVAARILLEKSLLTTLFTSPSALVSLRLFDCGLQDSFAIGLAVQLSRPQSSPSALRSLHLSRNSISDQGAEALAKALPATLEELDLSRNRLTQTGILLFADLLQAPSRCPKLKLLHLECPGRCVSLSAFHRFAGVIEDNYAIHSLTLGSEVLNWFNDTVPKEWKEMDAFLAYWWLEPAYRNVTDRIRFLLVINHAFDGTKHSVGDVLSRVQPKHQVEAMYRMLKQNPTMLHTAQSKDRLED